MPGPRLTDRSRRLGLLLPVTVTGSDLAGRFFTEATRTLNVSGGGLAFETRRRLEIGGRVVLEVRIPSKLRPHFGGRDRYRVRAVICRVQLPEDGLANIGVRFLGEA
ncbi:MAG TPA: PilZ domain-containing protein [Vicinamibacteria bacterium]